MTTPNIRSIFDQALEIASAAERQAFLDEACAGAPEIREQVEALLAAHAAAGSFLEAPPSAVVDAGPTLDRPVSERPGTQIGPYKLLQQIGEGGFGIVFMAEQVEPVRRRVALKVIKPGMDTRQVIARFEAERQALAVMDHPNIARVLDAGATESGRPYFVMELVRGTPITQYCDENNVPVRERLELFASVCQAIQHAHTKGIIHRDIKPTNVLVTRQDGHPVVKVIDFGIAKAMGQQLTDKTLFTDFAQMIGTPLYMSPEQAELSSNDIDTRSDIYSLGVLLYELLTGSTPVSKEQLKQAAFDEIRRIIREEEPPKPSTRISTAEAAPSIAAQRHTEPARLARLVRGELDWIVMKALEKDRSRRYETASALSADLQHYLNDEPVVACPPTAAYRFAKFARRNKGRLAASGLIAITLLVATGASLAAAVAFRGMAKQNFALAISLNKALADARHNLTEVKKQEAHANRNLALATAEQQRAEGNLDLALKALDAVYLDAVGTDKLLGSPRPKPGDADFSPIMRAPLTDLERELLRRGLSFYDEFARQNTGTARAADQTAQAYYRVGLLHAALGDASAAQSAYQAAIERFAKLVDDVPSNAEYHQGLAASYEGLSRTIADWDTAKPFVDQSLRSYTTAISLATDSAELYSQRARVHYTLGDLAGFDNDLAAAADKDPTNMHRQVIAAAVLSNRNIERAKPYGERALKLDPNSAPAHVAMARSYPKSSPKQLEHLSRAIELDSKYSLAYHFRSEYYGYNGEHERALQDIDRSLELGDAGAALWRSAIIRTRLGRYDEAREHLDRFLAENPNDAHAHIRYGEWHLAQGQYEQALRRFDLAISIYQTGEYWWYTRRATAFYELGRFEESLNDLRTAWELEPSDLSTLTWIPPAAVARCADNNFKQGVLQLATEAVATNPEARKKRAAIAEHLGRWDVAREDLIEMMKDGNAPLFVYSRLALISLADRDQEAYRLTCREMFAKFAESKDAQELNLTVWTAAFAPQALDDYAPLIALAKRGVELNQDKLGAILYRAGKYEEAAQQLAPLAASSETTSPEAKSSAAYPLFFLAMAQQQLGKKDEARASVKKAISLSTEELADEKNPPSWYRKQTLELLRQEAQALLGISPAPEPNPGPAADSPPEG